MTTGAISGFGFIGFPPSPDYALRCRPGVLTREPSLQRWCLVPCHGFMGWSLELSQTKNQGSGRGRDLPSYAVVAQNLEQSFPDMQGNLKGRELN